MLGYKTLKNYSQAFSEALRGLRRQMEADSKLWREVREEYDRKHKECYNRCGIWSAVGGYGTRICDSNCPFGRER